MNSPLKIVNHPGFIADLKAAHKGQGTLKLRGRNKNRKQFYPETNRVRSYNGKMFTRKSRFQQDLPIAYATYFAVYSSNMPVVKAVVNIYKTNGMDVLYTS